MPGKARVDESRGRVSQEAQASQRGFPFQARRDVIGQGHVFKGGAQHELARVQDERFVTGIHQARQLSLLFRRID